ncbi:hypothetical protein SAMN04487967_2488 [Natronorubrum sediminis]|uniref:Uncharacterized protein n=1 Tax=Natronorubrum sediminis TaxID=640943 RepID=A0A1H6G163_9EURY|nr:hypothetical protein [Natronorubrum sediminis]SEH16198.1 hypothetical protein SAMN04487967_2488 [Natronorubrum sediminis]
MAPDRESCGRCSMSVAVDVVRAHQGTDEEGEYGPYSGERIEVEERELRYVSPGFWLSKLTSKLERATTRFVWNR